MKNWFWLGSEGIFAETRMLRWSSMRAMRVLVPPISMHKYML